MLLTKTDLDDMLGKGCAVPGCDHHDHTMFIHSKCHVDVPLELALVGPQKTAVLLCIQCNSITAEFAAKKINMKETARYCCDGAKGCDGAFWASYARWSGVVVGTCYFCKQEAFRIYLEDRP